MDPNQILEIVEAAAVLLPKLVQLGQQVRDQLSTDDQARLDAGLAALQGQRQAAVAQAEADLDAAAAG